MSNTKNLANLASALDDASSGQVLQSTGSGGVAFADASSGVTIHNTQAAMLTDAASADEGTLHYETDNNRLYVKTSTGFYLLASITNASPTIDSFSANTGGVGASNLTADGTLTLTEGSNTVITINASDANFDTLSYSATVTSGTATNVFSSPSFPVSNQSGNTFTLTPASATGGTVTIRFDVSDGTNVSNVSHSFTLTFASWANATQQAKLVASDAAATDYFGEGVSSSNNGNRIIISAYLEDPDNISAAGSAYIFTRSGSTWSQEAKIQASDAEATAYFGTSVAISGDASYAIAGAPRDDAVSTDSGAAYIFSRSGTTWSQQQKIQSSDLSGNDRFGQSADIDSDGDTAVVGAFLEGTGGSAYIFTRSGTTWSQEAKINSSDVQSGDGFGYAASISNDGNTVAVGAYTEDTNGSNAGSVYVFTRSGTTWTQQAKIQASDAQQDDQFGRSVRVSGDGDNIIVGSYNEDPSGLSNAGSAYVFTRSGTTWSQEAKLVASDVTSGDRFGSSVGISTDGNAVVVGAYQEATGGTGAGAAYIFTRDGTTWTQQDQIFASDAEASDAFGAAADMSGDASTVIIGANTEDPDSISNAGSVYVFVKG